MDQNVPMASQPAQAWGAGSSMTNAGRAEPIMARRSAGPSTLAGKAVFFVDKKHGKRVHPHGGLSAGLQAALPRCAVFVVQT